MYWFGKFIQNTKFDLSCAQKLLERAQEQEKVMRMTPIQEIIEVLNQVGQQWHVEGKWFNKALNELPAEISFSREMIAETLKIIPQLLNADVLRQRVNAEIGNLNVLNQFSSVNDFSGTVKAFPLGCLLHVSAGNVFLGCIDSLLMGFLTKNISILKLSTHNQIFPQLFAQSILEVDSKRILSDSYAIVHWKGGQEDVENYFKNNINAILAWGGEEMVQNYRKNLGMGTKLYDYGPKISVQVIFKNEFARHGIEGICEKIARDISLWDQQACASPQNLFFEEGIDPKSLLNAVAQALQKVTLSRGELDADEATEIQKERFRAIYSKKVEGGDFIEGNSYLLHYETTPMLRPSPLFRTLIFKKFKNIEDLLDQLSPFSWYLQSCSYLVNEENKDEILDRLGAIGFKRFSPLGQVMMSKVGAPHDGRYGLRDLLQFIPDERQESLYEFIMATINQVPYYKQITGGREITCLRDLPLSNAEVFSKFPIYESSELLNSNSSTGYIFSSGGTSGRPKYTFYSYDEFIQVAKMLAIGIRAQGLKEGDLVANLFVAGNMWSSFMAIEKALQFCKVTQLPIGGTLEAEAIISYLKQFKPRAILGLPSLIMSYANFCLKNNIELEVPQIFYAGEHLNVGMRKALGEIWKTKMFSSAGYASVDAGPIGYQCEHCQPGEHHLFSDFVHLEVLQNEAVVTSRFRSSMPIIRYQTGDQVEMSEEQCPCGRQDPKFFLFGRLDGMINIWSCRLQVKDIEKSLNESGINATIYQIRLSTTDKNGVLEDCLSVAIEGCKVERSAELEIIKLIYKNSKDLYATYPFERIQDWIQIQGVENNSIPRIARTGKVKLVLDKR